MKPINPDIVLKPVKEYVLMAVGMLMAYDTKQYSNMVYKFGLLHLLNFFLYS